MAVGTCASFGFHREKIYAKQKGFTFEPFIAKATLRTLVIDGQTTQVNAYKINGYTYFKIRDLAMLLKGTGKKFNVAWDAGNRAINILSNTEYVPVGGELAVSTNLTSYEPKQTASTIYVNGVKTLFTTYTINNNTYFKLRDVAKTIDFSTEWDGNIQIKTDLSYVDEE